MDVYLQKYADFCTIDKNKLYFADQPLDRPNITVYSRHEYAVKYTYREESL